MKRYFWGAGRMDRRPYWIAFVLLVAGTWLVHAVAQTAVIGFGMSAMVIGPVLLLFQAASGWALVCIAAQRLHDFGRSGWWQLAGFGLAFVALALAEPAWAAGLGLSETAAGLAGIAGGSIYVGFLAAIGAPRGSTGPNRFGPADPT
jgi:uncharacterized membrane protein YhaH (DUF805 family)